jgi:hypothetical protein
LKHTDKYWYRLLKHFETNFYIQNGLTVPFIIGSRIIIEPDKPVQKISELFQDIQQTNCSVSVLECDFIGEYVFSLSNESNKSYYRSFENLIIIDNSFPTAANISDIIKELEIRYNHKIHAGHFSRIDGEWDNFSKDIDIPRLKEIVFF